MAIDFEEEKFGNDLKINRYNIQKQTGERGLLSWLIKKNIVNDKKKALVVAVVIVIVCLVASIIIIFRSLNVFQDKTPSVIIKIKT